MKVHKGEGSGSSILDAQIEYSCDDAKNFDCSNSTLDSYGGDEASVRSFCDLQMRLSEISATSVGKTSEYMLHEEIKDAYASTCTVVSKIQPTPPPLPIFLSIIESDFKVWLQGNVHDRLDILKLRKMMNSSLIQEDTNGFYVDLRICNVVGMNYRFALLDADARLIPPWMDSRCLSIHGRVDKIPILALNYHEPVLEIFDGDNEGRRSAVRRAFDPGGDRSRQAYVINDSLLCFFVFPP